MLITGIILVVLSTFAHVTWNFICKAKMPSGAFFAVLTVIAMVILTPGLYLGRAFFTTAPAEFWVLLTISGVTQGVYSILLAKSYQRSDISVAYPLSRSIPVLLTPLVVAIFGVGKELPISVIIGMVLIFMGCLILPLKRFREVSNYLSYFNFGMVLIVLTAITTTAYSIVDGMAVKLLPTDGNDIGSITLGVFYRYCNNLAILLVLIPYILSSKFERQELISLLCGKERRSMLTAGVASCGYVLVLAAMTMTQNVSYVVAIRQLSIPLGAFMGIWLLKEPLTKPKLLGVILLVVGIITVVVIGAN